MEKKEKIFKVNFTTQFTFQKISQNVLKKKSGVSANQPPFCPSTLFFPHSIFELDCILKHAMGNTNESQNNGEDLSELSDISEGEKEEELFEQDD